MNEVDYSQFLSLTSEPASSLWADEEDYGQNVLNLFSRFIVLPNLEVQLPIILSYLLVPSALSRQLPILCCQGLAGSGKSTIGNFASKLRGVPIMSPTDTSAALRNQLESLKFRGGLEQNTLMIWDDIDLGIFEAKPDIYRMLKSGYSRATDTITISSQKSGENLKFRTFAPKLFSTCSKPWSLPEYGELTRRLAVIRTAKTNQPTEDVQSYNWAEIPQKYHSFWGDTENIMAWIKLRKSLASKYNSGINLLIPKDYWELMLDLGATAELFNFVSSWTNFLPCYYGWLQNQYQSSASSTNLLLADWLKVESARWGQYCDELGIANDYCLSASLLKAKLEHWDKEGLLEQKITPKKLNELMSQLGWHLTPKGWKKHD